MYQYEGEGIILIQCARCQRKVGRDECISEKLLEEFTKSRSPGNHTSVPGGCTQLLAVGSLGFGRACPGRQGLLISIGCRTEVSGLKKLFRKGTHISHLPFTYNSASSCHQRKMLSLHFSLKSQTLAFLWQNLI